MKACIFLANGFEEIEALVPFDVLKRAGIVVTTFGVGDRLIKGSHNLIVETDKAIESYSFGYDVIILPGGLPGATNLKDNEIVTKALLEQNEKGKLIAAICASPAAVLGPLGLLDGKEATCYPGTDATFYPEFEFLKANVVVSKNLVTGKAPGAAWEFALTIARLLCGQECAQTIINSTYLPRV